MGKRTATAAEKQAQHERRREYQRQWKRANREHVLAQNRAHGAAKRAEERATRSARTDLCESPGCEVTMAGRRSSARFCSPRCQRVAWNEARRIQPAERVCERPGCDRVVRNKRSDARFCAPRCYKAMARVRNPERVRGQEAASKARHAPAVRARKKRYYDENRDTILPRMKAYYEANREQAAERNRRRYERNGDQRREQSRQYRKANRDKVLAWDATYRALKRDATVEVFDPVEIFERDGWVCGICTEPIDPNVRYPDHECASLDHVIPLSRDGEHSRANTQASHLRCNKSKNARIPA